VLAARTEVPRVAVDRAGDLEIAQDLDFERGEWRVERVAYVAMALVVAAALLGLLGGGPLSRTTAGAPGAPVRVEYERILRVQSAAALRVDVTPGAGSPGEARVWLDPAWVEGVTMREVVPEPLRVERRRDRLVYVLAVPDPGAGARVSFHFEATRPGWRRARVGAGGGAAVTFTQLVLP
jgi:hypothetical protein